MDVPEPNYAKTRDGAHIAYQVVGEGPIDIAWQLDLAIGIELSWELPLEEAFFEDLASFARLILHDRRGFGLSSRTVAPPNLETRASDLRPVLDAARSRRAMLGADSESMAPCLLLASNDPAPTLLLVDEANTDDRGIADQVAARMPRATVEALPRASSSSGVRVPPTSSGRHPPLRRRQTNPGSGHDSLHGAVHDIVGSTQLQARLGDRGWKTLVQRHHAIVRQALRDWDGFENDTVGDGFYATFRGLVRPPARPVRLQHRARRGAALPRVPPSPDERRLRTGGLGRERRSFRRVPPPRSMGDPSDAGRRLHHRVPDEAVSQRVDRNRLHSAQSVVFAIIGLTLII